MGMFIVCSCSLQVFIYLYSVVVAAALLLSLSLLLRLSVHCWNCLLLALDRSCLNTWISVCVYICAFLTYFFVYGFFPCFVFFPSFFRSCCFSIVRTFANSRCFQLNKLLCALLSIFGDAMCHGDATPECINKQNKYECRRKKTKQHTSTHTRAPTRSWNQRMNERTNGMEWKYNYEYVKPQTKYGYTKPKESNCCTRNANIRVSPSTSYSAKQKSLCFSVAKEYRPHFTLANVSVRMHSHMDPQTHSPNIKEVQCKRALCGTFCGQREETTNEIRLIGIRHVIPSEAKVTSESPTPSATT